MRPAFGYDCAGKLKRFGLRLFLTAFYCCTVLYLQDISVQTNSIFDRLQIAVENGVFFSEVFYAAVKKYKNSS